MTSSSYRYECLDAVAVTAMLLCGILAGCGDTDKQDAPERNPSTVAPSLQSVTDFLKQPIGL